MPVVTGDTKVVEKGKGDGVFITTTGVGVVPEGVHISGDRARPGDRILVSGTIGDHGVAIMSLRENLSFETTIRSDTAALHGLVAAMVHAVPGIHCLRDPTRGGVATTLNELASQSGAGMLIDEAAVPVQRPVEAACEFLGLDPLVRRQRRQADRDLRAGRRRAAARARCARTRSAATPRSSAR